MNALNKSWFAGIMGQKGGGFDLSNATYSSVAYTHGLAETNMYGMRFSPDGLHMYAMGQNTARMYHFELSTAFDMSTAAYNGDYLSVSGYLSYPLSMDISQDGTKVYATDEGSGYVKQWTLSTPWDLSSGSYASKTLNGSAQNTNNRCMRMSINGLKCYIAAYYAGSARIYQYDLSTAWDISSATYSGHYATAPGETTVRALEVSPKGNKLFWVGQSGRTMYQYTLNTPFSLASYSSDGVSLSFAPQDLYPKGMAFNKNGDALYVVNTNNKTYHKYNL